MSDAVATRDTGFGYDYKKGITMTELVIDAESGQEKRVFSMKQLLGNALFATGFFFLGSYLHKRKQVKERVAELTTKSSEKEKSA